MASTKTVIAAAAALTAAAAILRSRGDRADKPARRGPTPPSIKHQVPDLSAGNPFWPGR